MLSSVFDMCHRIVCLATGDRNPNSASSSVGLPSPPLAHNRKPSLASRRPSTIVEEQPSESSALISEPSPSPLPRRQKLVEQKVNSEKHDGETEQSPPDPVCTRPKHSDRLPSSEMSLSGVDAKTDLAKEFIDQLPTYWSPSSSSSYPSSSSYDSSEGSAVRWASVQLAPQIPSLYETTTPAQRTRSYPQLRPATEVLASSAQQQSPANSSTGPPTLPPRSLSDNAGLKLTTSEDKCLLSLESVLVASSRPTRNYSSEDRLVIMKAQQRQRRPPHRLHAIYENLPAPPHIIGDDAGSTSRPPLVDTSRPPPVSSSAAITANDDDERRRTSVSEEKSLLLLESQPQPSPPPSIPAECLVHRNGQVFTASPIVESRGTFVQLASSDSSGFRSDPSTAPAQLGYDEGENDEDRREDIRTTKVLIVEYLPDDLAFRTDSACSDHPSLDTTTIDMDLSSRADVDAIYSFADTMSKSIERQSISSVFGDRRRPTPSARKRTPSPSMGSLEQKAIAESASDEAAISRLDSTSQLLTDSFSMYESRVCDMAPVESLGTSEPAGVGSHGQEEAIQGSWLELLLAGQPAPQYPLAFEHEDMAGQAEPDYPLAFEPERMAGQPEPHYPLAFESERVAGAGEAVEATAADAVNELDLETGATTLDMAAYGSATQASDQPFPTVIRGPTFKATRAKPAIWSPSRAVPNGSISESKNVYSSTPLSTPIQNAKVAGYSPVPFFPTSNGADDGLLPSSTNSLLSPERIHPGRTSDFAKRGTALEAMTSANGVVSNAAPAASDATVLVPTSPPRPPPASIHAASSLLAGSEYGYPPSSKPLSEAPVANDQGRSVVEYPEKQSVASLRSAIESKLNGTAPIKSVPSSPIFASLPRDIASKNKGSPLKSKLDSNSASAYRPAPIQRQQIYQRPADAPPSSNSSGYHTSSKEDTASVSSQRLPRDATDRYKSSASGTPGTATPTSTSLAHSLLPSVIERCKTTTTIPREPLLDAGKTIEGVKTNLLSSLASLNEPERSRAKDYATPLSVTTSSTVPATMTTSGVGWPPAGRTETPPRPPLPADMASPIPPVIPPPPVGFVMQPSPTSTTTTSWTTQQYRDGRGESATYSTPSDRNGIAGRFKETGVGREAFLAPRRTGAGTEVQQRPIDPHSRRTENYYASAPADSKTAAYATGHQQFVKRADYKRESGRKTPIGLMQHGPNADYQHYWYKMMYKKLHQVPRREDPNPYSVTYKFSDYASDPEDAGEMDSDHTVVSNLSYYTLPGRGTKRYERELPPARSVRSKSAGRYETSSPPLAPPPPPPAQLQPPAAVHSPHEAEVIRSSTPGERYRLQPRSIENYLPGTSSALHYEQEKQRVNTLTNIRPQSAAAFSSRYDYGLRTGSGLGGYDFSDVESTSAHNQKHRELSPLSREESRYWYQSVQTGGDAPLTGFRQPAPERRDSIFRTAIAAALWASGGGFGASTALSALHGGGSAGAHDRRYRSASSEGATRTRNAYAQTSGSPRRQHLSRRSRARRPCYGSYWKRAFQSSPGPLSAVHTARIGVREFAPLDVRVDSDDGMGRAERYYEGEGGVRWSDTRYSFSPPVRSSDLGSKLYAFERSKIKDFHLPFFRLTPPSSAVSGCSTCSRSVEFEIEAYFTYLRQFCEAEGAKLEKGVQADGYDNPPWLDDYEASVHEKRRLDSEFQRTCDSLREALREIESLASPTRLRWRRTPRKDQGQRSIHDETVVELSSSTMTRSYSLPNGVGISQFSVSGDRQIAVGQTPSSYAILKRRRQVPEKYSWVQNGDDTAEHLAAAEELLASTASAKPSDSGVKRVSSLPQISEHTETTGSRPRTSKSTEGLSKSNGQDDKTIAADTSRREGSQDTTDVSQSMDSMEAEETATATATNTITEKRAQAAQSLKQELRPAPKSVFKGGQSDGDHHPGEPLVLPSGDSDILQTQLDRPAVPSSSSIVTDGDAVARGAQILTAQSQLGYTFMERFRQPLTIFQPFPTLGRRWGNGFACMDAFIWPQRCEWMRKRPKLVVNKRRVACSSAAARAVAVANKCKFRSLFKSPSSSFESPSQRLLESSGRIRSTGERLNNHNSDEFAKLEKELVLEDERRKKQEKELEDQRARRHGYVPAKSPVLCGDERFENLFHEYTSGGFGRNVTATPSLAAASQKQGSELRVVARALYNFVAQSPREISFRRGDLIKIRRQLDDNWYEGEMQGRVGILPANYVDLCATAHTDERAAVTEMNMRSDGQAQVLFSFDGRSGNELPLRKGEFITLIKKIDENWYEGKNTNGRRGMFPANYVTVVKEPSNKSLNFVAAFGSSASPHYGKSDDSLSKLLVNGVLYDKKNGSVESGGRGWPSSSHITKTTSSGTENGAAAPTSNRGGFDPKLQESQFQRTTRKELRTNGTEALGAALSTGHPETFQALFPYKPQNPDELELKETDIVYVVEKCDDGWYIGSSLRTGRFGTFPGNYVKAV